MAEKMSQEVRQATCDHDWQTFIDPSSGGYDRCRKCKLVRDGEDPDGELESI